MPSLRGTPEGSYVPVLEIVDKSELLAEARTELERIRKKYSDLEQLAGVWEAVDDL